MPFVVGLITSLLIVIGVMFLGDAVFTLSTVRTLCVCVDGVV